MLNSHILLQAMSSTQDTPSRQLQSTDQVPLADQPQPLSGPSGPNPLPGDATSQHIRRKPFVSTTSYQISVLTGYDAIPAPFQHGYDLSNSVGGIPTSSTQHHQQNSQGGRSPFSTPQPPGFTDWSVGFFLFRVFIFVSD